MHEITDVGFAPEYLDTLPEILPFPGFVMEDLMQKNKELSSLS